MISRGIWRRLNGTLILAGYGFALRLFAQSYTELLQKPILTEAEGHSMMFSFVERSLHPIELPSTLKEWEARKPLLRHQIQQIVGLENLDQRDLVKWVSKGFLDRDGYTIV